ncbi:MAG: GAF domain-containing protein, partial [Candidatus Hodarchaeales archaeon]
PLLVNNVAECKFYRELDSEVKSEMTVPITAEGEVFGVINVESQILNAFTEEDLAILITLAERAASTIMRHELEQKLQGVHELGYLIANSMDYQESFQQIASFTSKILYYKYFAIFELLKTCELSVIAHRGYKDIDVIEQKISIDSPDHFIAQVARTKKRLFMDDISQATSYCEVSADVKAEYAIPMNLFNEQKGRMECIGIINAESTKPFTDVDKFIFEALADQTLIAMRLWKAHQQSNTE